ncbi:ABC transporter substrate-binding protein [Microbacterium sp. LWH7-1.2]|uniref:ABC transporter substrate-binding protein n=1 Tax=Microbacterium sp. LWH7-1.2 TaxID=3135257 RepID=UPI00313889CF
MWNLPEGEPPTLDPKDAATYSGATVVSNLCDPLLAIDEDYNLRPNLVSFAAPDPLTLIYTLEPEATFWNGSPVTVDDIVFSLTRAADPASITSFLFANVANIEATTEREVRVTFSRPDVMFNAEMATFAGSVVEREYAETVGSAFGTPTGGIMCSGPYSLASWEPGDSIVLERNPAYWNKEIPSLVERAKFTFVTDSTASTQALSTGEIDGSYQIDPSAIPVLKDASAGSLVFGPSMESLQLYVARPDGPLAEVDLRRALQQSIDRAALAATVYNGAAEPLYTVLTPRTWPNAQRETYSGAYAKWAEQRQYDPDRAQSLVDESSYSGDPLVLGIPAGQATISSVAQLLQQQSKAVGININIKDIQPLDYATAAYDEPTRTRLGLDLMIGTSFNAAAEPLEPLGFTLSEGAPYNYTNFSDASVSALLEEARGTLDADRRAELIVEAQDIAEDSSATVPLLSLSTTTFVNSRLGGAITSFAYMSMPAIAYLGGVTAQ